MASKRARRMKEELKQAQAERGTAIKAAVELKNKLTTLKETSKKEIAALQAKVVKVGMSTCTCSFIPCMILHVANSTEPGIMVSTYSNSIDSLDAFSLYFINILPYLYVLTI